VGRTIDLHGYTNRKLSVVSGPRFEPTLSGQGTTLPELTV